jgi:putative hydrolase of the HAD superfamily
VAFDLGNTLVEYYRPTEFAAILDEAIKYSYQVLSPIASVGLAEAYQVAYRENTEQPDWRVRPLFERLARIFGLSVSVDPEIKERACREFLQPIFTRARVYQDTVPTLRRLRADGYRLAIVSNAPWGSPAELWREELQWLDLAREVDVSMFCVDVGWRKPAPPVFVAALEKLGVSPAECVFLGDHPRWDVEGARAIGMTSVLIDRANEYPDHVGSRIQCLSELWPLVQTDVKPRTSTG